MTFPGLGDWLGNEKSSDGKVNLKNKCSCISDAFIWAVPPWTCVPPRAGLCY